ncbi:complement C3-like [Conger conger]|uniref:complement C3-like n=1 Tax=Conger conger TaxID=82655 RepID=UPI002A599933|nr:complement C3-like [Conger conger]
MCVNVVWLATLALSLPALSQCDPLFVVTAPNLLRVGSKENVFLEAQGYEGPNINAEIMVKDFPAKTTELFSTKLTLKADNNFQALQEILLPEAYFEEETNQQQYVSLKATINDKEYEKVIMVSFQSGYIFVQTDKSIYTPRSTVLYRVFALNPGLEPVTSGVSVEIMTPDGITVQRDIVQPDKGVKSGQYPLPEIVSEGTWTVVCRFQNTPQKNFTADFEVKEYVLPSFEVKLTPEKSFFYVDDKELSIDITARYLFGKDVFGKAFVVFGMVTKDGQKTIIPASLQRVPIEAGKGKAKLTREQIQKTPLPKDVDMVSIYVSVSVLTHTGSEMVVAERTGILIVTSPYTIHFTKTPSYFKPGMYFQVAVYVTNPDGSPAQGIDVEGPGESSGRTQGNGIAKLIVNTNGDAKNLPITVRTKDPALTNEQQAKAQMIAKAYATKDNSKNYLHISIQSGELKMGDDLVISLNTRDGPGSQGQKQFTYLVLSKGQLVHAGRQLGQAMVAIQLRVTKDMVPSFRIVAYYHVANEVVSDSIWVDVKDTCMGTLKVTTSKPKEFYEPRKPFSLTITGDPGAKVGLVAVDKGVYVLNSKNRLTQSKIWDIVEKHDIGCTPGSGAHSMGVFYDAGLAFESSIDKTEPRSEPNCPVPPKSRRRRSLTLTELKSSLAANYTGLERQCCQDGMVENLLGFTCERRSLYIVDGKDCAEAFVHCCLIVEKKTEEAKTEDLLLARSEDDDYYISDTEIVSRTQFPESWLWEELSLPGCPGGKQDCLSTSFTRSSYLKDSITTWEVTAISLSKDYGICVADPFEMTVRKNFFIKLKLPYAAVRNEQMEIKAVLYNYLEEAIQVRVELMETEHVCSAASKKKKHRMPDVIVDSMSSHTVPFVIIPMALGLHSIEVKAAVYDSTQTDGVKRDLLVVPEGLKTTKQVTNLVLNPAEHGGIQKQRIAAVNLTSRVPGSPAQTYISVTGELLSQTIQAAISGKPMGSLIQQPGGCGEQNMIRVTGPVIATHYLDKTGQWEQVGLDRRAEAIKFINLGYTQQLAYRNAEGAYSIWANGNPSSWLTAYVAKVFGMAYNLITIQEDVLCSALKWLVLNSQQPDGIFKEVGQVYSAGLVGGVRGKDSEASMTAFVLIALQEAPHICVEKVKSLPDSMKKAKEFLSGKIHSLTNPYAVALTAYALSNEGNHHLDILNGFSYEQTHWPVPGSHFFTLEATGYALMALVNAKKFDQAGKVVKWLTEQRFHGGGYGSTQATVIVFQAVAMYMRQVSAVKDVDLHVSLDVAGRTKPIKWSYSKSNAHITRSEKTRIDQDLTVTAKGTGQGTMSVVTIYNALPEEKKVDCTMFDLTVRLERERKATMEDAHETYKLTIDLLYRSNRDSTMSIVDVTMLTGFIPDEKDLQRLTTGKDKNVQRIETDKQLSEKGSLIFYLDKVSHKLSDRVVFRIHKINRVGLLQPAAVSVYEYNSKENHCRKFYHPEKKDGALNRICHEDVCRCAEEKCSYQKKQDSEQEFDRVTIACSAGMDYVYKAKLIRPYLSYTIDRFTVLVEEVIKEGTDSGLKGKQRTFMAHPSCREAIGLKEGKTYLIMGKSDDLIRDEDGMQYMLGEDTWIEYWPTEPECQEPAFQETCQGIREATADLVTFGCPT